MMKRSRLQDGWRTLVLAMIGLALAAWPSHAAVVNKTLCATTGTVTMPDTTVVPVWGFVETDAATCLGGSPPAADLPGPVLDGLTAGDTLNITLANALAENVSIVIPGMAATPAGGVSGVFGREAAPGGSVTYTWTARAGTFLYHSMSNPKVQVPMGLYGALAVTAAPGQVYPGVAFDSQVVLLYSELSTAMNADPSPGHATPKNYKPDYFLVNGRPFADGVTLPIAAGGVGQKVLVRMLNIGFKSHMPMLLNAGYMDLVAEDGNPYPYPKRQYLANLAPGKTMDGIWVPGAEGVYSVVDRSHHLTSAGVGGGGMLAKLQVGPAGPTAETVTILRARYSAADDQLRVWVTSDALATCNAGGAEVTLTLAGHTPSSTVYTSDPSVLNGCYVRIYANAVTSNPGTATVNSSGGGSDTEAVGFTEPPVALADSYTVDEGAILNIPVNGVLGNDLVGGWMLNANALKALQQTAPLHGSLTLDPNGGFVYTHNGSETQVDSFTYRAQAYNTGTLADLGDPSAPGIVTITINPVNDPPLAVNDSAATGLTVPVVIDVLANDTDPEGDALSVNSVGGLTAGSGSVLITNGSQNVTYTPAAGFTGAATFNYTASDGNGGVSNLALVTVQVSAAGNVAPVAVDDGASTRFDTPKVINVIANDYDPDGGTIVASSVCLRFADCANLAPRTTKRGGSVVSNGDGTVTYTPPTQAFLGTDLFRYTVKDDSGLESNQGTVRINVTQ